ncbi:MAG: serine/threonine-protein kinase [Balneolia bacterium]|nr:serine/threonine-protein kinase [Balneolia bacterium]
MNNSRWQEISQVLDQVLSVDESEQLTWLEENFGHDKELVTQVREMLFSISESREHDFLNADTNDHAELLSDVKEFFLDETADAEDLIGQMVGPYKIEGILGKGGMGNVYRAARADGQFEQTVAIKFIQNQQQSSQRIERFRQEQKILANLNHPNIAMLLDGGVTDNGFPYLIMECVQGVRIDEYCRERKLSVNQRLELFKKILSAINYAHSNLIVHRDLKPNNILVTPQGDVKILDFGIAKLMTEELDDDKLLTRTGQRFWTPYYAAPEQVLEQPARVQTDIYSLGVLLFSLLTDSLPFDFKDKSIHEIERMIVEDQPCQMSQSASMSSEDFIKESFGLRKKTLIKTLRRDLDAIADMAIRKEPELRYPSVSALYDDICRYQKDIPVRAKKGSFSYRARKYMKRNRQPIISAALLFLTITALVSFYTYQLNQQRELAEKEAVKSQQVADFMVGIFQSANSFTQDSDVTGLDTPIRDILDFSIGKMDDELADQPELNARVKTTLSRMYVMLGEIERAEKLASDALAMLSDLDSVSQEQLALSFYKLARVHQEQSNNETADSLLVMSLELYEGTESGMVNAEALMARSLYANMQWFTFGRFEAADSVLSDNLRIRYTHFPENLSSLAVGHVDLASMNHSRGHFKEAQENYVRAIELYEESIGDHPSLGITLSNYSILLREYHNLKRAEEVQLRALEIFYDQLGPNNIDVGLSYANLGETAMMGGNYSKADSLLDQGLTVLKDIYGDVHPYVARANIVKAKLLEKHGHTAEAEELLLSTLDDFRNFFPPNNPRHSDPLLATGTFYLDNDQPQTALYYLEQAYEIRRTAYSSENWRTAIAMSKYGEALMRNGDESRGEALMRESIRVLSGLFGDEHPYTDAARQRLRFLASLD